MFECSNTLTLFLMSTYEFAVKRFQIHYINKSLPLLIFQNCINTLHLPTSIFLLLYHPSSYLPVDALLTIKCRNGKRNDNLYLNFWI